MGLLLNLITEIIFLVVIVLMLLIDFYSYDTQIKQTICRYTIGTFYFMITFQVNSN